MELEPTRLGGTPTEVYCSAPGFTGCVVVNTGTVDVWLDTRRDVSPDTGLRIAPGEKLTLPTATNTSYPQPRLFGVTAAGEPGEVSAVRFG